MFHLDISYPEMDEDEQDDISLHSFPQYPPVPIVRFDSKESLHSITRQSKWIELIGYKVTFHWDSL